MPQLRDKIAIVTGASSGIGRAAAKLFAAECARVVVGARRAEALQALAEEIRRDGGEAIVVAGDVRDEAFSDRLADAASSLGGLDIAFNNAGVLGELDAADRLSVDGWRETLDVNLTGAFLAARRQLPLLIARGGGSLIFTGSFVGVSAGMPGMAAYAASKAGLVGLTQVLAAEFGPQAVRVNALLPGGTDTEMARVNAGSPEAMAFVRNLHALKRIAEPEEIARAALFLASDASSFVTGASLYADGGVSINRT